MQALVYEQYGPPEVLELREVPVPRPAPDEILIRVDAVEVTKADCELRSFRFPVKWFWLPLRIALGLRRPRRQILGNYFAGEVTEVGSGVTRFQSGQLIFGCAQLRMGAYAQYLCLPASYTLAPLPTNTSAHQAASIPLGGLNALHFLRRAALRPGERVLVNGAGGSIGICAVQIARSMGAQVTAVDSGHKEALLREIGAQEFIDYTRESLDGCAGAYDVVFDMVAGSSWSACFGALRPGGRLLIGNPSLLDMLRAAWFSRFSDRSAIFAFAGEREEELLALRDMLEQGLLRPILDGVYPLAQAVQAHRRVESEQRLGAVILSPDPLPPEGDG